LQKKSFRKKAIFSFFEKGANPISKVGGVGGCAQFIFSEIKTKSISSCGGQISTKYNDVISLKNE